MTAAAEDDRRLRTLLGRVRQAEQRRAVLEQRGGHDSSELVAAQVDERIATRMLADRALRLLGLPPLDEQPAEPVIVISQQDAHAIALVLTQATVPGDTEGARARRRALARHLQEHR